MDIKIKSPKIRMVSNNTNSAYTVLGIIATLIISAIILTNLFKQKKKDNNPVRTITVQNNPTTLVQNKND
jgi:hypothetical protein